MKTFFIEARSKQNLKAAAKAALPKLKKYKKIGLATTVQHVSQLDNARKELEKAGKETFIGELPEELPKKQGIYSHYSGQVLGCDVISAKSIEGEVDCFLYLGTGEFHPIYIAILTEKPVVTANPFSCNVGEISEQDKRKYLAKQAARVSKFNDSKVVGILVSTKPGQLYPAAKAKAFIEKLGKKAVLFIGDTIQPESLADFQGVECWVNTACPRMVDDQERYPKPIVNIDEINRN